MTISARHLAAALSYEGADVESALLELACVSPALDARVRAALFHHCELPKLRFVTSRGTCDLHFIHNQVPRWVCAMHAVDQVCRVLDDADVVKYLRSRFSEYQLDTMIERGL